MKNITNGQVADLACKNGVEYATLKAIIEVESGGIGFSETTGKIIIQFEPHWFQKYTGIRILNGVDNQVKEWEAFNKAFKIDPDAAMMSTSVGMMQVMGFHYKLLGFKSVGEMWDYAKVSEVNQVDLAIRFIKSNPKLYKAVNNNDFETVAYYYNGELYKKFKYDTRLETARAKYA